MICATNHRSAGNNRRFATPFLSGILLLTMAIQAVASNPPQPANATTTFSNPINLSESEDVISTNPSITTVGNRVYVLWQDLCVETDDLICDVFFRRSTDGGETFEDVVNLSNTEQGLSQNPRLVAAGDNVYVAWEEEGEIFFKASNDGGETFEDVVNLSNSEDPSFDLRMATLGERVYLAWNENIESANLEVFFRASNDGGETFEDAINLSDDPETSGFSEIAAFDNNVYVIWQGGTVDNIEVFFRASNDGGETFDDVINLSNNEGQSGIELQVAAFSNNVYVSWRDLSFGGDTALFRASTDRGATFDDAIDLGEELGISFLGQMVAAPGNRIYGIGGGPEFPPDVVLARSTDGGETFDSTSLSDIAISSVPLSDHVRIAVSGSNRISLVYEDPSGLLFRQSNDGGETFDDAITLADSEGNPSIPRLALSGNNVFVVWQDDRLGDLEIFFARSS